MPTIITYNNGADPVRSFTISDEVVASLEQFRLTFGDKYPTTEDMFKDFLNQFCIAQALKKFPTTEVQTALSDIATAQDNYAIALQTAIEGALG